jgi:hypothetical protein
MSISTDILSYTSYSRCSDGKHIKILLAYTLHRSLGSRLWAGQTRVQITVEIKYSFLQNIQIGSGPHPDSYPINTAGCFPTGKLGRHGVCCSPQSSAQVKNEWRS